jgi:hypothetical protein
MHEHGKRVSTEPSVDADHVYFSSEVGVTAVRRDNGRVVWQHLIDKGSSESTPLPIGDRVYAAG